jgi:hypothetical protein
VATSLVTVRDLLGLIPTKPGNAVESSNLFGLRIMKKYIKLWAINKVLIIPEKRKYSRKFTLKDSCEFCGSEIIFAEDGEDKICDDCLYKLLE